LEFGDDRRPDVEPPGQDLHGRAAQTAGAVGEIDACLAVQVQGADVEPGEFGYVPAGIGHECGHRGSADRRGGVGVDGPAEGQVVKEALGVGGGEVVTSGGGGGGGGVG